MSLKLAVCLEWNASSTDSNRFVIIAMGNDSDYSTTLFIICFTNFYTLRDLKYPTTVLYSTVDLIVQ